MLHANARIYANLKYHVRFVYFRVKLNAQFALFKEILNCRIQCEFVLTFVYTYRIPASLKPSQQWL